MKKIFIGAILLFSYFVIFNSEVKAWWDTEWTYKIPVTIDNSSNSNNLTDYQVKISLTSANTDFWAHVDSLGKDIRLVDSDDATKLNYWLKHFDYEAQTASIWVKVPSISASSNKTIYLYLTNFEASSESSESNVMETSPQTFWTTTYHSGNSATGAEKTVFLSDGDVVVAGNYVDFVGNIDWLIRRYSSDGNSVVWEQTYVSGGVGNQAYDVAVDSDDNIIVVGYRNLADRDWHIRKYDSDGNLLWSKSYDFGSGIDSATAVAVDSDDNVIVTGYRADLGDQDWHTKKFNSEGEELWNVNYDSGTGSEIALDVAVDSGNNIIVVGSSAGSGTRVFYMIKYSVNLEEVWSESYEKGTNPSFMAVGVDLNDNIVAGGFYTETNTNWLVRKYDSNGSAVWSRLYDSGNGDDTLFDLAIDSLNNIVAVGRISAGVALYDWMLRKYDSVGEIVWTSVEDIDRKDLASGVAFNSDDDFVVCGWYSTDDSDLNWRIRMYGERQYTDSEPYSSLGSLAKTAEKSFNNYVRFNSDSEDIKYISVNKKFSLKFLKLPDNPSRYWIEIKRNKKWPSFIDQRKTVKYYWRLKTNLYKAKGKKPFKLYLYFNYTKKSVKKRLKVKDLKLYWKQKNYIDEKWKEKKAKLNKKKRFLRAQMRKFRYLNNWFAISR